MSYIQINGTGGTAGGGIAVSLLSAGHTSGALALVSSGTLQLAGGNNITLSQNGQSITISGAANAGGGTLSIWEPMPINMVSTQTKVLGQSTLFVYPLYLQANLSATQFMNLMSVTVSTSTNSSWAAALSESVGIYTLTGSTLNLLTASSGATNVAFTNTSNNSTLSLQGMRGFTIPLTMNATPGNYWVGFISATASTNANWVTMSNMAASVANSIYSGQIGDAGAAASRGVFRGAPGFYSVQTAALPATIGLAELTASQLLTNAFLYMNFQG